MLSTCEMEKVVSAFWADFTPGLRELAGRVMYHKCSKDCFANGFCRERFPFPEQELPEVREGFFTCSRVKRDDTKAGDETRHVTTYAPFLALWGGHANTVAVNGSVHYLYVTKYIVGAILADSARTSGR